MKLSNNSFGVALVITAMFLLSFRSILVILAYIEDVSVMSLLYYRFLFTIPLLISFAFYKKRILHFSSITIIGASRFSIINASGPVIIGAFSVVSSLFISEKRKIKSSV